MIFLFGALCVWFLFSFRIRKKDDLPPLSLNETLIIRGVCALIIILSHLRQYSSFDNQFDQSLIRILDIIGQFSVAPFLFFSGYGVSESIKKDKTYPLLMPVNRILRILLDFDLMLIPFFILSFIGREPYSIQTYFLSLIGLSSIGNSSWFLFAILVMYFLTFLCFAPWPSKKGPWVRTGLLCCLVLAYVLVMKKLGYDSWWFDTALCYPLGFLIALSKDLVAKRINKSWIKKSLFALTLMTFFGIYILPSILNKTNLYFDIGGQLLGCLFIVSTLLLFKLKSRSLTFIGKASLEIFVLQRIPMIIFSSYLKISNYILFGYVCFLIAVLLGLAWMFLTKTINGITIDPLLKWAKARMSGPISSDDQK